MSNDLLSDAMDDIYAWRKGIFESSLKIICDPSLPMIQKATGVWDWHVGIPLPSRKEAVVLDSGVMNLTVKTNQTMGDILFSVWLFLGEVRIGVKIPKKILSRGDELTRDIPLSHDGTSCSRIKDYDGTIMFDWIFKDGFASHAFMTSSLTNKVYAAAIADSIANITTNIYMSVINLIIGHANLVISPEQSGLESKEKCLSTVIEVKGDYNASVEVLKHMGIHVNDAWQQEDGRAFVGCIITDPDYAQKMKVAMENAGIEAIVKFTIPGKY